MNTGQLVMLISVTTQVAVLKTPYAIVLEFKIMRIQQFKAHQKVLCHRLRSQHISGIQKMFFCLLNLDDNDLCQSWVIYTVRHHGTEGQINFSTKWVESR